MKYKVYHDIVTTLVLMIAHLCVGCKGLDVRNFTDNIYTHHCISVSKALKKP